MRILIPLFLFAALVGADSSGARRSRIERFLVSVSGEGVFLFDLKGQIVWSHRCQPYDASEWGAGRVLITERSAGRVFAVTRDGKEVWEKAGLNSPVDADPLPNGNVLILENGAGRVIEVAPNGEVVWERGGLSNPFDAERLPNGNTLVADSGNGRIVEFNPRGDVVHEKTGLNFPNSILRLPNGRTLFTTYTSGTAGELDRDGTLLWEHKVGGTLYSVAAEGDALWVSDGAGGRVVKLNRQGKILQEIKLGKSFVDAAFCR